MIEKLLNFCAMGGYGFYVFSAYSCVVVFLLIQWLIPWQRWQNYIKNTSE